MLLIVDEIVVGSCLSALLKSYAESIPILIPRQVPPTIDLKLKRPIEIEQLTTDSHSEAWSMLKFLCAMRGLVINTNSLDYVKICNENVSFSGVEIQYVKCHLFPEPSVKSGLEIVKVLDDNIYKIIDFMRLKFCDASNLVSFSVKDSFISTISSVTKKEIYAVSYLKREDLTNFEYSDTMVRFATQKMLMEQDSLHRPLIHKGGTSRRVPKLAVTERVVVPMREVQYKSDKKVKFYDRKKRKDIIKTYRRNHSSI